MEYKLPYQQFAEALKQGKLLGLKCSSCRAITTPPRFSCGQCGSTQLVVAELSGLGQIESFTVIRAAPEPFLAPYIVCMVKLLEGPRLMGNLTNVAADAINLGFIDRKVKVGHRVLTGDKLLTKERIAITFEAIHTP
jgi:uncharacterized OB-fold protein